MKNLRYKAFFALVVCAAPVVWGQASESSVNKELQALRAPAGPAMPGAPADPGKAGVSEADRPAAILKAATDIHSLPVGAAKVKLGDALLRIAVQGEVGKDALQGSADTLAEALSTTPQAAAKDGMPGPAYMDLARLSEIAGIKTTLKDAQLEKAIEVEKANEATRRRPTLR